MAASRPAVRLLALLIALQSLFTVRMLSESGHSVTDATAVKISPDKESRLRQSHGGGHRRGTSDYAGDGTRQLSAQIASVGDPQSQAYDTLDEFQQDGYYDAEAEDDYYDDEDYDYSPDTDEAAYSAAGAAGTREVIDASFLVRLAQSSASVSARSLWHNGPHVCKHVEEYSLQVAESTAAAMGNDTSPDRGRHPTRQAKTEDLRGTCYETDSAYHCRTEIMVAADRKMVSTVILECCDGYRRIGQSCVYVKNLTDLASTARRHDGGVFAREATRLYPWIGKGVGRNVTLFAPLDKYMVISKEDGRRSALEALRERHMDGSNKASGLHHQLHQHQLLQAAIEELVPAHIVDGYAFSSGFERDMVLATHRPSAGIRINVYGEQPKLITANCLPLKSIDNLASNGLLHIVDGLMVPTAETIWQKLQTDKRFSRFAALIAEEFPEDQMDLNQPGHYTVFAPTNAAVENAKMTDLCTHRTLKRHIIPHVICSHAIASEKTYETLDGTDISLRKLPSGAIILSGKTHVLSTDIMATNGVIHIVDNLLRLSDGYESKASTAQLLEFNSLISAIRSTNDLIRNVTLFIPSRRDAGNITKDITETILEDAEELTKFIKYHVAPGIVTCDKFSHQVNTSLGIPIRMQTYATYPFEYVVHTANCVRILRKNIRTCQSIIHEVEEVLVPPTRNIIEIIEGHPNLSLFSKVLTRSAIYDELAAGATPYTVYAPDDKAMGNWISENHDDQSFEKLVLRHIVAGYKCCAGVFPAPYYTQVENEAGWQMKLLRDASGTVHMSGDVAILECDVVATNGVVHIIDEVIPDLVQMRGKTDLPIS